MAHSNPIRSCVLGAHWLVHSHRVAGAGESDRQHRLCLMRRARGRLRPAIPERRIAGRRREWSLAGGDISDPGVQPDGVVTPWFRASSESSASRVTDLGASRPAAFELAEEVLDVA